MAILVVAILLMTGADAFNMSVNIQPSSSVSVGNNLVKLNCKYTTQNNEAVLLISWQKENAKKDYDNIATFHPPGLDQKYPTFANTSVGDSLKQRAKLNNPSADNTAATLTVDDITCTDEGSYRCVITIFSVETGEKPEYQNVYLTTNAKGEEPSVLKIMSYQVGYEEGHSLTVSCTANVGKPLGKIRWWLYRALANGPKEMPSTNNVLPTVRPGICKYNITSSLTIILTEHDNGAIARCSVDQDLLTTVGHDSNGPNRQTNPINVFFKVGKPKITYSPKVKVFEYGSNVTFRCTVAGNPNPETTIDDVLNKFTWNFKKHRYDEESLVEHLEGVTVFRGTFHITNLTEIHQGFYICRAQNGFLGKVYYSERWMQLLEYVPNVIEEDLKASPKDRSTFPYGILIGVFVCVLLAPVGVAVYCKLRK